MRRTAQEFDRDPAAIDLAYLWFKPSSWQVEIGTDGRRRMLSGNADDMRADAAALQAMGVRHCVLYVQQPTIEPTLELQQRFAEDVIVER